MCDFIHRFMEDEGTPVIRSSEECMNYLKERYSTQIAKGILGRAVALGYIFSFYNNKKKMYSV